MNLWLHLCHRSWIWDEDEKGVGHLSSFNVARKSLGHVTSSEVFGNQVQVDGRVENVGPKQFEDCIRCVSSECQQ